MAIYSCDGVWEHTRDRIQTQIDTLNSLPKLTVNPPTRAMVETGEGKSVCAYACVCVCVWAARGGEGEGEGVLIEEVECGYGYVYIYDTWTTGKGTLGSPPRTSDVPLNSHSCTRNP